MKSRHVRAGAALAAALLALSPSVIPPAQATGEAAQAAPSPENATATLTITFELAGAGEDLPESGERHVTWTVADRFTVTATMTATKPGGFASMHPPDAEEQALEAERLAAVNSAATNMQSMMEQAQKIAELCGDDEACIQAEAMKMSQGVDMSSPEMQAAQADIAAASAMPGVRYQMFASGTQTGSFSVADSARAAYFDAACSLATEARCAVETVVRGEGATDFGDGATEVPSGAMAELDLEAGSLMLSLTVLGFATAEKTVASANPEVESGTTETIRSVSLDEMPDGPIEVSCGACRTASGSFEREVSDQLLGYPAKLVVTWSFTRP